MRTGPIGSRITSAVLTFTECWKSWPSSCSRGEILLGRFRQRGSGKATAELAGTLLHLFVLFGIAAEHEILLMPTHHQHGHEQARLIDAQGRPSSIVHVVGVLRRGALWESTAIPELRQQAAEAARLLLQA